MTVDCINAKCGERLDREQRFGLCPSCWFMLRAGIQLGAGLLTGLGFLFALLLHFAKGGI